MKNRAALRQLLIVAAISAGLTALMLGVFALIGRFSMNVLAGGIVGWLISIVNFFALTVTVSNAADAAEKGGNTKGAAMQIQASGTIRLLILLGIYVLLFMTTSIDRIAALAPLILTQAAIRLYGFFGKEEKTE